MRSLFSYSEQYLPARDDFSAMFSVKCVVIIVFSWLLTTLLLSGRPFLALSGMLVCQLTAVWRFRERRDTLPIALACPLPFLRFSVCVLPVAFTCFPFWRRNELSHRLRLALLSALCLGFSHGHGFSFLCCSPSVPRCE